MIWSPVIGTLILMSCYYPLKTDKINAQQAYLIGAYAIALEVAIHTHYLGWNTGFFLLFVFVTCCILTEPSMEIMVGCHF